MSARSLIHFRLGDGGRDWLDSIAVEYGLTRSQVLRICLNIARRHAVEVKQAAREEQ